MGALAPRYAVSLLAGGHTPARPAERRPVLSCPSMRELNSLMVFGEVYEGGTTRDRTQYTPEFRRETARLVSYAGRELAKFWFPVLIRPEEPRCGRCVLRRVWRHQGGCRTR